MYWFKKLLFCLSASAVIISCDDAPKHADTTTAGTIEISVDETYQPVIDEELKVFDTSNPDAHITVHYKPEAECIKDFIDGKTKLILVTRDLSKQEKDYCEQKKEFVTSRALARDGIAVILNKESTDSLLDLDALRGILTGIYKKKYTVVFDNQASSTVRFINDSILKGARLGSNVFAAKGNKEVVDYVTKNPDAIGFVGLGYVSDENDPANTGAFIKSVQVAQIKNDSTGEFLQPYQAYIALRTYPLTRTLYYINSESYRGLYTGFADFLTTQRGQLVFFHAHLFPVISEMVIRQAEVNNGN